MFCSKCGSILPEGALFCPKCGNQIADTEATGLSGRGIKVRYSPYTKKFDYWYSSNCKEWRSISDIMIGKLNPLSWERIHDIVKIFVECPDYYEGEKLQMVFEGCEDNYNALKKVCSGYNCKVIWNQSNKIDSPEVVYDRILCEAEQIKKELRNEEDLISEFEQISKTAAVCSDKANACMQLGNFLKKCIERIENYEVGERDSNTYQSIVEKLDARLRSKTNWLLIPQYKWQDLKTLSKQKLSDDENKIELRKMMLEKLRDYMVANIFKIYEGKDIGLIGTSNRDIPFVELGITQSKIRETFDRYISGNFTQNLNRYIEEKLAVQTRGNQTIKKIKEANEMNSIMFDAVQSLKDPLVDNFEKCLEDCIDKKYSHSNTGVENKEELLKKYKGLESELNYRTNFSN